MPMVPLTLAPLAVNQTPVDVLVMEEFVTVATPLESVTTPRIICENEVPADPSTVVLAKVAAPVVERVPVVIPPPTISDFPIPMPPARVTDAATVDVASVVRDEVMPPPAVKEPLMVAPRLAVKEPVVVRLTSYKN